MLTPEPGTVVGGKYRILRALGEGGMGTVYAAENLLTLKRAAIKWLHPRVIAVEEASQRLLYEARATARIRHRNVVDIYDVVVEGESIFLVMELLLGEQLSTYLAREQLCVHEVVALLLPAMRGVAAAHDAGVVHRDIKPDNIFLSREPGSNEPVPKVIDFGISRVFEAEGARLTRSGVTMGTPRYVSYEQLRGLRDVDPRCDVYAFGVILYESVVGRPPYQASTFGEQAISFVTTVPATPREQRPELPEALDAVIGAAIAKEREQRTASMRELIAALEPFSHATAYAAPLSAHKLELSGRHLAADPAQTTAPQSPTPVPADPPPGAPQPGRTLRRARGFSMQMAALGLVGGAGFVVATAWPGPGGGLDGRGAAGAELAPKPVPAEPAKSELAAPASSPLPHAEVTGAAEAIGASAAQVAPALPASPARLRNTPGRALRAPATRAAAPSSTTVTISEHSKVEPTAVLADGSASGAGEAAREVSSDQIGRAEDASSKPQATPADAVHRAGRLERTEF